MPAYISITSSLVCLTALFDWLERLTPTKRSTKVLFANARAEVGGEEDLSAYHPLYQQLKALQKRQRETNTPNTFVEHARIGRQLVTVEKKWQDELDNMPPDEKHRHLDFISGKTRPVSSKRLPRVATIDGAKKFLPLIKIIAFWILVHAWIGYSESIKNAPLFVLPAGFFSPFVNSSTGRVYFPFSFITTPISSEVVARYIDPDQNGNAYPKMPGGGVLVSLSFFATVFLLARGYARLRHLLASPESCFRKVVCKPAK